MSSTGWPVACIEVERLARVIREHLREILHALAGLPSSQSAAFR